MCLCVSPGEEIEITFSYWDGSGHRKTVKVKHDEKRQHVWGQSTHTSSVFSQQIHWTWHLCVCVRACVQMKKGNTIQNFLQRALEVLRKDFSELRWDTETLVTQTRSINEPIRFSLSVLSRHPHSCFAAICWIIPTCLNYLLRTCLLIMTQLYYYYF